MSLPAAQMIQRQFTHSVVSGLAKPLDYLPGRFCLTDLFGLGYSLRSVVFHHISNTECAFTRGLGVTISPKDFEAALSFLACHYNPIRLDDLLASGSKRMPRRPVLVTFDDSYASIRNWAAPLCSSYRIPAVFFVNAAYLENRQLSLDNLICYVVNTLGVGIINAAIRTVPRISHCEVCAMEQVFHNILPLLSPTEVDNFRRALIHLSGINEGRLARDASLYLSHQQLHELADFDFEIGNHTYSHVNCRSLSWEGLKEQLDNNKFKLEEISRAAVRSFSVPYGSSRDLTPPLITHLQQTGHQAAFLSEGHSNPAPVDVFHLDRVSLASGNSAALFSELEVLPLLRRVRAYIMRSDPKTGDRQQK